MTADEVPDIIPELFGDDPMGNSSAQYECFANGTLLVPLVVESQNMTLSDSDQVNSSVLHLWWVVFQLPQKLVLSIFPPSKNMLGFSALSVCVLRG